MRNYSKVLLPILIIATAFGVSGCSGGGGQSGGSAITRNDKGQILAPTERNWNKEVLRDSVSLKSDLTDSLYQPIRIKEFGQQLYVIDAGQMKLKKFTKRGKYLGSFGKKGSGPGEFQFAINFDLRNDTLFVIDTRRRKFMQFDAASTDFLTSEDMKFHSYQMAMLDDAFIFEVNMSKKLFSVADARLNVKRQFGHFIEDQRKNGVAVSGPVAAASDTGFVFVPTTASYLYFFDRQGHRTKTIRTPDRIPLQEPKVRSSGDRKFISPPDSKVRTKEVVTRGDKICVLQNYTKEDEAMPASFMDVYELGSGRYLYSVKFPMPASDLSLGDEILYVLNDKTSRVQAYHYRL